jgi:hypothetical protein
MASALRTQACRTVRITFKTKMAPGGHMSQEQDAIFFRNFTLVLVALTIFGIFAAIMGRHFAAMASRDSVPATAEQPAASAE